MSLYTTLWNLKCLSRTCYAVKLLQKETPEFILPQLWPPISSDLNSVITVCGNYSKRKCYTKHTLLIWTNWNSDWKQSGPSWIMSLLRQSFSGVVDSSRSLMRVLYNFFCNISETRLSSQMDSILAKLEATAVEVVYISQERSKMFT